MIDPFAVSEWERFNEWANPDLGVWEMSAQRGLSLDVSAWDAAIFEAIGYDSGYFTSDARLFEVAFGLYAVEAPETARASLQRCLEKGWIHYLTADFIRRKARELAEGGYELAHGLFGWCGDDIDDVSVGLLSFTEAGAELAKRLWAPYPPWEWDVRPHWAIGYSQHFRQDVAYGETREACEEACLGSGISPEVLARKMQPIGRWCDRWWNRFESGYRVVLESNE